MHDSSRSNTDTTTRGRTMQATTMRVTALLTAATLAVAGCSNNDDASVAPDVESVPAPTTEDDPVETTTVEADVETAPAATPDPELEDPAEPDTPEPPTSRRGNLIKELGETAGVYDLDEGPDSVWLEFKITDIETNGECTSDYADPPQNGHFLIVSITASTGSKLSDELYGSEVSFDSYDFSVIGPDGVTENDVDGNAYMCLAERDLIPSLGPGENATGKIVLDIASESGTLVFKPWFMYEGGWEWEF
jgi:hypothetical protein